MNPKSIIELVLTVFGIPVFMFSYFDDIQMWASSFDVWKSVVLAIIGGGTMLVILCRQGIKMLKEWDEYINRNKTNFDNNKK